MLLQTMGFFAMSDGLLEDIIALEKRIQAEVAAERARAHEWQERELASLEEAIDTADTLEQEHYRQTLEARQKALEQENSALEKAAEDWCERLSKLDQTTLHDVMKRHLAVILPGGDHDHPHGQS